MNKLYRALEIEADLLAARQSLYHAKLMEGHFFKEGGHDNPSHPPMQKRRRWFRKVRRLLEKQRQLKSS